MIMEPIIATTQVLDNAIGTPSLSLEVLDQAGTEGHRILIISVISLIPPLQHCSG